MRRLSFVIILLCHSFAPSQSAEKSEDRIKWQDLRNITLRSGQFTTVMYGRPVLQVRCDECKNEFGEEVDDCECRIRSVTCTSQGIRKNSKRYPPLDWKCTSETTPADYTLVVKGVTCDCFTDCRDDNIRISSCSLTYWLKPPPPEALLEDRYWDWCLRTFTDLFGPFLGLWAARIALLLFYIVSGAVILALLVLMVFIYLMIYLRVEELHLQQSRQARTANKTVAKRQKADTASSTTDPSGKDADSGIVQMDHIPASTRSGQNVTPFAAIDSLS